jgi:hypothetical protein
MSETHSVNVGGVNRLFSAEAIDVECVGEPLLVPDDPPADVAVGDTLNAEHGGGASCSVSGYSADTDRRGETDSRIRRALLASVAEV